MRLISWNVNGLRACVKKGFEDILAGNTTNTGTTSNAGNTNAINTNTKSSNVQNLDTFRNIMNTDILPYYKQSNYEKGIRRGTYILAQTVAQAEGVKIKKQGVCPPALSPSASNSHNNDSIPWWAWPIVILGALCSPRRRRFSSGSFGGFGGGGGFGGSGCSGSW